MLPVSGLFAQGAVYNLSISNVFAYDSRYDTAGGYGAVGDHGWIAGENGLYNSADDWEGVYDNIWAQAGIDWVNEAPVALDINTLASGGTFSINPLNFRSGAGSENDFYTGSNALLEAQFSSLVASTTGSVNSHIVLYAHDSFLGGTTNAGNTATAPSSNPLDGGITGVFQAPGAAWQAGTFNPNLRTIQSYGDVYNDSNFPNFTTGGSQYGWPTVLPHEIGHNLSLDHPNNPGLRTPTTEEHYDPTRGDLLLWTAGGASGTQNVLTAGQVADALLTADTSGSLALKAGQTGTVWDPLGASPGTNGSGTWDASSTSAWGRPTGSGPAGVWVGNEVAIFRASDNPTVTVSGSVTATGLAFQVGNHTLTGGSIDLTNAKIDADGVPEVYAASGVTATIHSAITGGAGENFTKIGKGDVHISNTGNTYTGDTHIRAGTLIGNGQSIRNDVVLHHHSNAALDAVVDFTQEDQNGAAVDNTFAGNISGDGEVRVNANATLANPGELLQNGNWSNDHNVRVFAGSLEADGTIVPNSGSGTITIDVGANLTGDGTITGGSLMVNGSLFDNYVGGVGGSSAADLVNHNLTVGATPVDLNGTGYFGLTANGANDMLSGSAGGSIDLMGSTIDVDLLGGFTPTAGNAFPLLKNFGSYTSAPTFNFANASLSAGLSWDTSTFLSDGTIRVAGSGAGNVWDTNGTTAGSGGATPNGVWSGANWSLDSADTAGGGTAVTAAWENNGGTGNVAVFSAGNDATGFYTVNHDTTGTVLTGVTSEQGIAFITGNALALNETPTGVNATGHNQGGATNAEFNIGASMIITAPLTDDATPGDGLTKTGNGFLALAAANTYTGETTVASGLLRNNGSLTSDVTVQSGATFDGSGSQNGDLTVQAGGNFSPGVTEGIYTITGTGNAVVFDDDANINYSLTAPLGSKASSAASGDNLVVSPGNSIDFDGNLRITDGGGFDTGFYELVNVDLPDETMSFTNDSTDFAVVPDNTLAYRVESGLDLVVAEMPNPLIDGSTSTLINLGSFAAGASGGIGSYTLDNVLSGELLRLFADDLMITGMSGSSSLFNPGFLGSTDLLAGTAQTFNPTFLGASATGLYTASYTFGWDSFTASALDNIAGLTASGTGANLLGITGDWYLPTDYTSGTLTLNLQAFVVVPEPSRAMLLLLGVMGVILRRQR